MLGSLFYFDSEGSAIDIFSATGGDELHVR
jgi:hypothetical protein